MVEAARDLRPIEVAVSVCITAAAVLARRGGLPREFFVECADEAYLLVEKAKGRADDDNRVA